MLQTGSACVNVVGWPGLRSTRLCWRKWRLYSLNPDDYATNPLFVPSKEIRFLNEFFLYVLEDLHTCSAAGASTSESARDSVTCVVGRRRCGRAYTRAGRHRQQSGAFADHELGDIANSGSGVGRTPSKTSRLQSAPRVCQVRQRTKVYSH
jgi:hypothetical protein